jgi:hypothetical protein
MSLPAPQLGLSSLTAEKLYLEASAFTTFQREGKCTPLVKGKKEAGEWQKPQTTVMGSKSRWFFFEACVSFSQRQEKSDAKSNDHMHARQCVPTTAPGSTG